MSEGMKGAKPATPIVISTKPTMPAEEVARLTEELKLSKCFLEYGAGGSTCLAASIGVPHIYSVESDKEYVSAVRKAVAALKSKSVLHSEIANIGPTKEWGMPVNNDAARNWPEYPLRVWSTLARDGMLPDLVLIDGRFRVASFLASVLHLAPGAMILFDDYTARENYHLVERHVQIFETVGRMTVFKVPAADKLDIKALAIDLTRHCTRVQ